MRARKPLKKTDLLRITTGLAAPSASSARPAKMESKPNAFSTCAVREEAPIAVTDAPSRNWKILYVISSITYLRRSAEDIARASSETLIHFLIVAGVRSTVPSTRSSALRASPPSVCTPASVALTS